VFRHDDVPQKIGARRRLSHPPTILAQAEDCQARSTELERSSTLTWVSQASLSPRRTLSVDTYKMIVDPGTNGRTTFLVVYGLLSSLAIITQGLHTLLTGSVRLFFFRKPAAEHRPGLYQRLGGGLLYLVPGTGLLLLLIRAAAHRHVPPLTLSEWAVSNAVSLVWVLSMGGPGVLLLIRPQTPIRWARTVYPELDPEDKKTRWISKCISVVMIGMAVFAFAALLLPVRSG